VLLPGERSRRTLAERSREGITLPEDTVARLSDLAARFGLPMPVGRGS
jgi:LDH2 family malate/lactate/ureidoglycolate dehydrogenase